MIAGLIVANPVVEGQHGHLVQNAFLLQRVGLAKGYQLFVGKYRNVNGAGELGAQALAADKQLTDLIFFILQNNQKTAGPAGHGMGQLYSCPSRTARNIWNLWTRPP